MSIFLVVLLACLAAILVGMIPALVWEIIDSCTSVYIDEKWVQITAVIIGLVFFVIGIFVGVGLVTEDERIYISKYEAEKAVIEQSLDSDVLTGLERVQLVTKAAELNGEFAERKARYERWHHVCYDNTLYDNIDFISLGD